MCLNFLFKISLHFKFSEFTFKFLFLPFLLWDPAKSCPWTVPLYLSCLPFSFWVIAPCAIATTTSPRRDFLQPARCFVGKDIRKVDGQFIRFSWKSENSVFTGIFSISDQLAQNFFHLQYHPSLGLWVYLISRCIQLSPTCPKEFWDTATSLTWINFTYTEDSTSPYCEKPVIWAKIRCLSPLSILVGWEGFP